METTSDSSLVKPNVYKSMHIAIEAYEKTKTTFKDVKNAYKDLKEISNLFTDNTSSRPIKIHDTIDKRFTMIEIIEEQLQKMFE